MGVCVRVLQIVSVVGLISVKITVECDFCCLSHAGTTVTGHATANEIHTYAHKHALVG